ncbi:aldolase [Zavarzinia sp. CC-PAN008]|uniref:aldolase n=1 Tax=Zavarzinia sp. CC-PAN008 TaxID=3243332 RepID=UPI003F744515
MDRTEIAEQRRLLAACFRLAVRHGLHEGVCNHFSVRLASADDVYLINPMGLHWSEITASNLVLCDGQGRTLEGDGEVEATAFYIHVEGHRAKPEAQCILHTHMPYATALTSLEDQRLRMVGQNALRFLKRVAYDEVYGGLALDSSEGQRIGAALKSGDIVFMKHHGVIVCGKSVQEAWQDLYYLERACQNQVLAASMGQPLQDVDGQTAHHTYQQMMKSQTEEANRYFAAMERVLTREEPDYRH